VFEDFTNFSDLLEEAIKEAGYFKGYDRVFEKTYLLDEDKEVADGLVKKANSIRAALYRAKSEVEALYAKAEGDGVLGTFDAEAFEADKIALQDRILILAFNVVRLREPFDDFLALNEIEVRKPYNPKAPRLGKKKREALGLPPA
jgi:hypothetical protein